MKILKLFIATTCLLGLTACLEVSEDGVDTTTTIRGRVVNAVDDDAVSSAAITVKLGSTTLVDSALSDGGDFTIEDLPNGSDLEMVISSPNDLFMPRAYYFTTGASSQSNTNQDLGTITVSEAISLSINVINSETSESIEGLQFEGYSGIGTGATASDHMHLSTYNTDTQRYEIDIPKFISTAVIAKVDIDGDREDEYEIDSYSYSTRDYDTGLYSIYINSANLDSFDIIELTDISAITEEELSTVEYRVSLMSPDLVSLPSGQVVVSDSNNDNVTSSYDEATEQHVVTAAYGEYLSLNVPSFTVGEVIYESAAIVISGDDLVNFYSSNAEESFNYYRTENAAYDLVLVLQEGGEEISYLEVVLDGINTDTNSYFVFYSEPVTIEEADISFTSSSIIPIRGNEDDTDFVLPGTTYLKTVNEVEFTYSLDLNDTRLTVTPTSTLTPLVNHNVNIGSITEVSTGLSEDIYSDVINFTPEPPPTDAFDIADATLDNFNYFNSGVIVNATNTAGAAASYSDNDSNVYILLPDAINTLQNFSLSIVGVIEDGISSATFSTYDIVDNGYIAADRTFLLNAAVNEDIDYDYYPSFVSGAAISEDVFQYRYYIGERFSDDTVTNENTITFDYIYEDQQGNITTGNMTLPVE